MSHRIYLNSSSLPQMPKGTLNEWRGFFGQGTELEAKDWLPLFWRALFGVGDIHRARFIDEYDVEDSESAVEREECLDDFGPDATYPYLVTDKAAALAHLAARRQSMLNSIGEQYRPIYEAFEMLIEQQFGQYVLLRPSGLPDIGEAEQWLRDQVGAVDHLAGSATLARAMGQLAWADADPVWLLAGLGSSSDGAWPPSTLREHFPDPRRHAARGSSNEGRDLAPAKQGPHVAGGQFIKFLEWAAPFAAAGGALGTYLVTKSVWLAVLAFLGAAVVLGLAIGKVHDMRRS